MLNEGKNRKISQAVAGRAFEYAILNKLYHELSTVQKVEIKKDIEYERIQESYNIVKKWEKETVEAYDEVARKFTKFFMDKDKRLTEKHGKKDTIILSRQPDGKGKKGDVRDILIQKNKLEIGISCKWNNESIRSPRLSDKNNFGKNWLGISCSESYLKKMKKIFKGTRTSKKKWSDINENEKIKKYYKPVCNAFISEFKALEKKDSLVAEKFVQFVLGKEDYYKIIGRFDESVVDIYNFKKTLPHKKIPLPTKIEKIEIVHVRKLEKNGITFSMSFDKGWQFHLRVHSADNELSPSLKLEITLGDHKPKSLQTYRL